MLLPLIDPLCHSQDFATVGSGSGRKHKTLSLHAGGGGGGGGFLQHSSSTRSRPTNVASGGGGGHALMSSASTSGGLDWWNGGGGRDEGPINQSKFIPYFEINHKWRLNIFDSESNSDLIDTDVPSTLSNNNGVLVAPGSAVATGGRLSAGGGGGSMGLWQPSNSVVIPVRERESYGCGRLSSADAMALI